MAERVWKTPDTSRAQLSLAPPRTAGSRERGEVVYGRGERAGAPRSCPGRHLGRGSPGANARASKPSPTPKRSVTAPPVSIEPNVDIRPAFANFKVMDHRREGRLPPRRSLRQGCQVPVSQAGEPSGR